MYVHMANPAEEGVKEPSYNIKRVKTLNLND
jgi:hypothetical protein